MNYCVLLQDYLDLFNIQIEAVVWSLLNKYRLMALISSSCRLRVTCDNSLLSSYIMYLEYCHYGNF